ncbi:gamma-glutamyltransferase [Sciscionella marina]|uniref:gamma-glutamyltransferase n=1 Tax=Sciscionella marina TaxID=508770 RepID=UPI00036D10B9|nr:gamma-glutamyltransferase [Sciscionella marina]
MLAKPVAALVTVLALVATPGMSAAAPNPPKNPVATGTGGAVVSDTAESTAAGMRVLKEGGTAADAAVAVGATLGVTDPYVAGLGGGGYAVYYDARTKKVSTIDGREKAPYSADKNRFIDKRTGKPMDRDIAINNGISVGVPGMLATWQRLLDRWGKFDLGKTLAPAQSVAAKGFTVDQVFADQTAQNQKRFSQFAPTAKLFLPAGKPPEAGSTFKNPDLARTYAQIRAHGTKAFYRGSIGRDLTKAVDNPPTAPGANIEPSSGRMSNADLATYRTADQRPAHSKYRGLDVYGMAPSSSGGVTVGEALNMLETKNLATMDRAEALHHYLEASRLAYADRDRYLGDPRYTPVPQRELLSQRYADARACLIDPEHAGKSPVAPGDPYRPDTGCTAKAGAPAQDKGRHTNHFVVTDKWGNVASYTNTIEQLGGSAITVPGRGFLLNNELTDFDFAPSAAGVPDPNLPAPGKRPRSAMSPTIVAKDGKPFLAVGSPGGSTIITTVLQILVDRIDFGMGLPEAIAAPRASQRNTAETQVEPAFLASPEAKKLEKLGQKFYVESTADQPGAEPTIGVADGLEFRAGGSVVAAGEPERRGGSAAAVMHSVG